MTRARIVVCLLLAGPAAAQTTGVISGRIVDAQTSRPVAGALVVAASPVLQGTVSTRTDSEGEFDIGLLPPGEYVLNVQADGHQAFSQERLLVHAGRTLEVQLPIVPESWTAAPLRIGLQVPVLPARTAQRGAVIGRQQLDLLPYGRDARTFEQPAASVPGLVGEPYGSSFQILGSPATGTRFRLDGLDVTDPASNRLGRRLLQEFVEEVSVDTGGLGAEYGRVASGMIHATTRSGGNELHGSAFLDWMPIEVPRRTLRYNLAGGAELGGPIEPDSLWFYGGFAPVLMATHSTVETDYQYVAKLTWRPAVGQTLALSAITNDLSLRYLGRLSELGADVEATAGWHHDDDNTSSVQAGVQVAQSVGLFGKHRLGYGADGVRDSAGDTKRWYGGVYLQDLWSPIDGVFVQEGLRLERDGKAQSTDLLPRVGVAWDFSGQGLSRAYLFFGRFIESSPLLGSAQRTRESDLSAGVQSQIFRDLVAGLDYVHKQFDDAPDGRTSYDGATLFVSKPFSTGTLLSASYTLSSLRGGPDVSGDAPHAIRLDAAYVYEWSARTTLSMGTSFRAIATSPWQTTVDVRLGMVHSFSSPYVLTVTADALNLLGREEGGAPPFAARFGARLSF